MRSIEAVIAGELVAGSVFTSAQPRQPSASSGEGAPAARRQVSIDGQRVRVIDIHAHATVAEVMPVVANTEYAKQDGGRSP